MGRALRLFCTLCVALVALAAPRDAEAKRQWRLLNSSRADDVVVMPGNLSAGAAASMDLTKAHWGPTVTAELFSGTWRRLSWNAAEMRLLFYRPCPKCGATADHFVGSRVGVILVSDRKRIHHLTLNGAVGWGAIGAGWGDRDPTRHGVVLSPSLRYTAFSVIGLEVAALAPAYAPGGRYPVAVTFNIVGGVLALAALSGAHP